MDFKLATPFLEAFEELNKLDEGLKTFKISYYEDGVKKSFTVQASSKAEAEQIGWSRVDADSLYVSEVVNEEVEEDPYDYGPYKTVKVTASKKFLAEARQNRIDEAIDDLDFEALVSAEEEADRLGKEIRELSKDYKTKISKALDSDEGHKKLKAAVKELQDQLRELRRTYERREWVRVGPDDYDHEDWVDEEAHEKVKDREAELLAEVQKMETDLRSLESQLTAQFEAENTTISAKGEEEKQHRATAKSIKDKLAQSYAEVEAEVTAVIEFLNNPPEDQYSDPQLVWKLKKPTVGYFKDHKRIAVSLCAYASGDLEDFDIDDYNDYGELDQSTAQAVADAIAEEHYMYPEQFVDLYGLEKSDDKWYRIPNSDWELFVEADIDAVETPKVSNYTQTPATYWEPASEDYDIDGDFAVQATIYIGKKVGAKVTEATKETLTEARSTAEIKAEIRALMTELRDAERAEKAAATTPPVAPSSPTTPTPTSVVWSYDIYLEEADKGTWTSVDNDLVFETKDKALDAAWLLLTELYDEGELEGDPDDYYIEAIDIPLKSVSKETLRYSNLSYLL